MGSLFTAPVLVPYGQQIGATTSEIASFTTVARLDEDPSHPGGFGQIFFELMSRSSRLTILERIRDLISLGRALTCGSGHPSWSLVHTKSTGHPGHEELQRVLSLSTPQNSALPNQPA